MSTKFELLIMCVFYLLCFHIYHFGEFLLHFLSQDKTGSERQSLQSKGNLR